MSTTQQLFEQAQLAEAAYANLWDAGVITNDIRVKAELIAEGFSDTQATEFLKKWSVVDHIPDTASGTPKGSETFRFLN